MTRILEKMKLSALAAVLVLTTTAGAQESGGAEYEIPPALIPYLNRISHAKVAHGTIMCLAFVIFFPAGSFIIRLGRFKGVVYVHAGIQMFAYIMALAGMGLGIYVSNVSTKFGSPSLIHQYHPIIGLTIISALLFQPILGSLHHAVYLRQHRRSIWSTLHVWWGRVLLTFAIIEGGLGLRFANNTTGGEIAYGVVAGLIWVSWLLVAVRHDMKKPEDQKFEEKRSDSEEVTITRSKGEAGSV